MFQILICFLLLQCPAYELKIVRSRSHLKLKVECAAVKIVDSNYYLTTSYPTISIY